VINAHIVAAEIAYRVVTKIGHPASTAAIDDDFALRIETCGAKDFLDAISRYEILGIFVAQYARRIADIDRTSNVSRRIGVARATVTVVGVRRDALRTISVTADRGDRSGANLGDLNPKDRQRKKKKPFNPAPLFAHPFVFFCFFPSLGMRLPSRCRGS